MKKYTGKIFMTGLVVFLFVSAGIGFYYMENYEDIYYTKVDNTKVKELIENKQYEYSLTSYNQKGKKKVLQFKTSRKLKEGAYLKLTVLISGVHQWEEVEEEKLPIATSKKLVSE